MRPRVSISHQIRSEALRLGFDAVGIARCDVKLD